MTRSENTLQNMAILGDSVGLTTLLPDKDSNLGYLGQNQASYH